MSRKIKKTFNSDFKARVAIAALKGDKSQSQLSGHFGVHATQIHLWKKQALESIKEAFSVRKTPKDKEQEELIANLYEQIGKLSVELEWVKKKSGVIY